MFLIVLVSTAAQPAAADDNIDIVDWVDSVAGDDEYYGLGSELVHSLFSSDSDLSDSERSDSGIADQLDEDTTTDEFVRTVTERGDYAYEDQLDGVANWNSRNRFEVSSGGPSKSVYPRDMMGDPALEDGSGGQLKDASVTFFSISPSTIVHYNQVRNVEGFTSEYRVGDTADVAILQSARTNAPESERGELRRETVRRTEFGVRYARLYSSDCGDGNPCQLAEEQNPRSAAEFTNVDIPQVTTQVLRAQSVYEVEYERTTQTRDRITKEVDAPKRDSADTRTVVVGYTDWETVREERIEDSVVVDAEQPVTVRNPRVTATKANLPGPYEGYYIEGLDQAEWSEIQFDDGGGAETAIRSGWRYFSARDSRFDLFCVAEGTSSLFSGAGGDCAGQAVHYEGDSSRPLRTHGIPGGERVSEGRSTTVLDVEQRPYPYANVENGFGHRSCNGDCQWNLLQYDEVDLSTDAYTAPSAIAVRRPTQADAVRVEGLVDSNSRPVKITNERDVHLAVIEVDKRLDGRDVPTGQRGQDSTLPEGDEIRTTVSLRDAETGAPLDLSKRPDEQIRITDGTVSYRVETGADGNATVNLQKTDGTYTFTYEARDWWTVPQGVQAYVGQNRLYSVSGVSYSGWGLLGYLVRIVILIGVPALVLVTAARAVGVDIDANALGKQLRKLLPG